MKTRAKFLHGLSDLGLTHAERAVALLWYYRETQEFEDRTASELATDLQDDGYPRPHVTRLRNALRRSRYAIRGRRGAAFQINARWLPELHDRFGDRLGARSAAVGDSILPTEWFAGTRAYLERMVHQVNGCYEYGFYDGCATLGRRLLESLLIEVYVSRQRHQEVQQNGVFVGLERLIAHICKDSTIALSRNAPRTMREVKQLGDFAAHDRVYITEQLDIDDLKARYRRLIRELGQLAGVIT